MINFAYQNRVFLDFTSITFDKFKEILEKVTRNKTSGLIQLI